MKIKIDLYLLVIIFLSLLPLNQFLHSGTPSSHDFVEHAARLASFYQSLAQGNIVPRWAGNLNYGYGHPVLMFLYPLTNYLGSLIHSLGFSFVDSIKILFSFSFVASGVFAYLWLKQVYSSTSAFVGALVYQFASYRFVNLFVRGALGEHLALAFVPLVLYLSHKPKKPLFTISVALLILSHNAVALMFLPVLVIYGFFIKKIKTILPGIILGLGLSAFFWLPALYEGKYTLREMVTTREVFANNYISAKELFVSNWGYGLSAYLGASSGFMVALSWFQWLALVAASFLVFFKKNLAGKTVIVFLLVFLAGAFLATSLSRPLLPFLPLVYRFQFPWRFLNLPLVASAFLIAFFVNRFKKIWLFLAVSIFVTSMGWWRIEHFKQNINDNYLLNEYTSTTETGESSPRWFLRFAESFPEAKVQLVSGKLDWVEVKKYDFEVHEFTASLTGPSQLVDNTLYFPGWQVWVDGRQVPVNFQDLNWRGLITFPVSHGQHDIKVVFASTKTRRLADIASLISLFAMIVVIKYNNDKKTKT